jgi:hypothetical protein
MPGLDNMPLARYLIARKLEALLQGRDAEEIMEAKTGKKGGRCCRRGGEEGLIYQWAAAHLFGGAKCGRGPPVNKPM